MNQETPTTGLPYNARVSLLEKILNDLKNSGKDGLKIETLWADIGAAKDTSRSYTLKLAKYLELVDFDGSKVWLTDHGFGLRYATMNEKNKILANKLQDKYLSMFKWILNDGELRSNEIKRKYVDTWGSNLSSIILDRTIATFLNYCDYIGIVSYTGRGNQAKASITEFGRTALGATPDAIEPGQGEKSKLEKSKSSSLSKDAAYPIIIQTRDRDFDWDVKSETDWTVIDSVIKSIREGWEKSRSKQEEKKPA